MTRLSDAASKVVEHFWYHSDRANMSDDAAKAMRALRVALLRHDQPYSDLQARYDKAGYGNLGEDFRDTTPPTKKKV